MDISELPFNRWLGIHVEEGAVRLLPSESHMNHLGTVHATVIYGLAEAASGHWLLHQFRNLQHTHHVVLRGSKVKYRRPAVMGNGIIGTGSCPADVADSFSSTLLDRGRATIEVLAAVTQGETELFNGSFRWLATQLP